MKRIALVLLVLCTGCSSSEQDNLLQDSLWGDVHALFSGDDKANSPTMTPAAAAYTYGSTDVRPKTTPNP